jgi:glutamate-1-semialdehyde 2,1-aminomutase
VDAAAVELAGAVTASLDAAGVPHRLQRAGSLFSVFLGVTTPVRDYAAAQEQDPGAYAALFHALLDAGVALPPSAFEAWFLSATHTSHVLERVVAALPAAATAAAKALAPRPASQVVDAS